MRKTLTFIFTVLFAISILNFANAGDDPDKKPSFDKFDLDKKYYSRDYNYELRKHNFKTNKIVDFYVDFQLGIGTSSYNVTTKPGYGTIETNAKPAWLFGALGYFNLFDIVKFSTGLSFNGKSFAIENPRYVNPVNTSDTIKQSSYVTGNYLNIPVNIHIGGMITEDIGLWFTGGPYLGFRMSDPNVTGLGYKNFDFGVNATITGNYVIQYPFSIIFGTTFEIGGLNNLGNTPVVDRISSLNFKFFSGVRFSL